jgi:hypothetical protein
MGFFFCSRHEHLYSVIIGVTLGVTREAFVTLMCAIVFHQLVEGMGLAAMLMEVCVCVWFLPWVMVWILICGNFLL